VEVSPTRNDFDIS